jgi:hypothetical protein
LRAEQGRLGNRRIATAAHSLRHTYRHTTLSRAECRNRDMVSVRGWGVTP